MLHGLGKASGRGHRSWEGVGGGMGQEEFMGVPSSLPPSQQESKWLLLGGKGEGLQDWLQNCQGMKKMKI